MEAAPEQPPINTTKEPKKKRGFLKRFRRKRKGSSEKSQSISAEEAQKAEVQTTTQDSKETKPISQEEQDPADSEFENEDETRDTDDDTISGQRNMPKPAVLNAAPAARDSAFSGPPRYDWIDIETAAAVKVQSIFRRNKVMDDLAAENKTTAAMRNQNRKRGTREGQMNFVNTEDTPSFFQCCGVGLMFGDAAEEDEKARKEWEKAQYEEKKRLKAAEEEKLRAYKPRNKGTVNMNEALEVVE